MSSEWNEEANEKLIAWLATHNLLSKRYLTEGFGGKEDACSIASINLALTGRLSDEIPECMSRVIGIWMSRAQDAMPDEQRNSHEWKRLLPLAAGTGRDKETSRRKIVMDWIEQVRADSAAAADDDDDDDARAAAEEAARKQFWAKANPCGLLQRLIEC